MRTSLSKSLGKFLDEPTGTLTKPNTSINIRINQRLAPLTKAERINLASHEYVILDGTDKQHLQLYYHQHGYGCTPYPLKDISSQATHFNLANIIGLRDHLLTLPFGSRLVKAMECGVLSVEHFREEIRKRH